MTGKKKRRRPLRRLASSPERFACPAKPGEPSVCTEDFRSASGNWYQEQLIFINHRLITSSGQYMGSIDLTAECLVVPRDENGDEGLLLRFQTTAPGGWIAQGDIVKITAPDYPRAFVPVERAVLLIDGERPVLGCVKLFPEWNLTPQIDRVHFRPLDYMEDHVKDVLEDLLPYDSLGEYLGLR